MPHKLIRTNIKCEYPNSTRTPAVDFMLQYSVHGMAPPGSEITETSIDAGMTVSMFATIGSDVACFQDRPQYAKIVTDRSHSLSHSQRLSDQDLLKVASTECIESKDKIHSHDGSAATAPTTKKEPSVKAEFCQESLKVTECQKSTADCSADDEDVKVKLESSDPDIWQDVADRPSPSPFAKRKQAETCTSSSSLKNKRKSSGCAEGGRKRRRRAVPQPRPCCDCGQIDIHSAFVTNCGHRLCYECYTDVKIEAEEVEGEESCPECNRKIKWFQCKP